jgi:hypothetical protein
MSAVKLGFLKLSIAYIAPLRQYASALVQPDLNADLNRCGRYRTEGFPASVQLTIGERSVFEREGTRQQAIGFLLDHAVTLTTQLFQLWPVQHRDPPTDVTDDPARWCADEQTQPLTARSV